MQLKLGAMRRHILAAIAATLLPSLGAQDVPVFKIEPVEGKITFDVKASVAIVGKFNKWDAKLTFTSPELSTGKLEIRIDAASVDTGSGMKNGKLKGDDFFDVKKNPEITFISKKFTAVGPNKVQIDGDFTIRGVTKQESLIFDVERSSDGKGGTIKGQMAFDRKQYGMTHGIPFIKIADRVQVDVNLIGHRISGPPVRIAAN